MLSSGAAQDNGAASIWEGERAELSGSMCCRQAGGLACLVMPAPFMEQRQTAGKEPGRPRPTSGPWGLCPRGPTPGVACKGGCVSRGGRARVRASLTTRPTQSRPSLAEVQCKENERNAAENTHADRHPEPPSDLDEQEAS